MTPRCIWCADEFEPTKNRAHYCSSVCEEDEMIFWEDERDLEEGVGYD